MKRLNMGTRGASTPLAIQQTIGTHAICAVVRVPKARPGPDGPLSVSLSSLLLLPLPPSPGARTHYPMRDGHQNAVTFFLWQRSDSQSWG